MVVSASTEAQPASGRRASAASPGQQCSSTYAMPDAGNAAHTSDTGAILTCSSCKIQLEHGTHVPRLLPSCLHTICAECASRCATEQGGLKCKLCLSASPAVSEHPLAEELLRHEQQQRTICGQCSERGVSVTAAGSCTECALDICTDCINAHKLTRITWGHTISLVEVPPSDQCQQHHKDQNQFCDTCGGVFCERCIIHDHRGHQSATLAEKDVEVRQQLSTRRESLKSLRSQLEGLQEQLRSQLTEAEQEKTASLGRINTHFQDYEKRVRGFFKEQLSVATKRYDEFTQELQGKLRAARIMETKLRHLDHFSHRLMESSRPRTRLSNASHVAGMVQRLSRINLRVDLERAQPKITMKSFLAIDRIGDMMNHLLYDGDQCIQPEMKIHLLKSFLGLSNLIIQSQLRGNPEFALKFIHVIFNSILSMPTMSKEVYELLVLFHQRMLASFTIQQQTEGFAAAAASAAASPTGSGAVAAPRPAPPVATSAAVPAAAAADSSPFSLTGEEASRVEQAVSSAAAATSTPSPAGAQARSGSGKAASTASVPRPIPPADITITTIPASDAAAVQPQRIALAPPRTATGRQRAAPTARATIHPVQPQQQRQQPQQQRQQQHQRQQQQQPQHTPVSQPQRIPAPQQQQYQPNQHQQYTVNQQQRQLSANQHGQYPANQQQQFQGNQRQFAASQQQCQASQQQQQQLPVNQQHHINQQQSAHLGHQQRRLSGQGSYQHVPQEQQQQMAQGQYPSHFADHLNQRTAQQQQMPQQVAYQQMPQQQMANQQMPQQQLFQQQIPQQQMHNQQMSQQQLFQQQLAQQQIAQQQMLQQQVADQQQMSSHLLQQQQMHPQAMSAPPQASPLVRMPPPPPYQRAQLPQPPQPPQPTQPTQPAQPTCVDQSVMQQNPQLASLLSSPSAAAAQQPPPAADGVQDLMRQVQRLAEEASTPPAAERQSPGLGVDWHSPATPRPVRPAGALSIPKEYRVRLGRKRMVDDSDESQLASKSAKSSANSSPQRDGSGTAGNSPQRPAQTTATEQRPESQEEEAECHLRIAETVSLQSGSQNKHQPETATQNQPNASTKSPPRSDLSRQSVMRTTSTPSECTGFLKSPVKSGEIVDELAALNAVVDECQAEQQRRQSEGTAAEIRTSPTATRCEGQASQRSIQPLNASPHKESSGKSAQNRPESNISSPELARASPRQAQASPEKSSAGNSAGRPIKQEPSPVTRPTFNEGTKYSASDGKATNMNESDSVPDPFPGVAIAVTKEEMEQVLRSPPHVLLEPMVVIPSGGWCFPAGAAQQQSATERRSHSAEQFGAQSAPAAHPQRRRVRSAEPCSGRGVAAAAQPGADDAPRERPAPLSRRNRRAFNCELVTREAQPPGQRPPNRYMLNRPAGGRPPAAGRAEQSTPTKAASEERSLEEFVLRHCAPRDRSVPDDTADETADIEICVEELVETGPASAPSVATVSLTDERDDAEAMQTADTAAGGVAPPVEKSDMPPVDCTHAEVLLEEENLPSEGGAAQSDEASVPTEKVAASEGGASPSRNETGLKEKNVPSVPSTPVPAETDATPLEGGASRTEEDSSAAERHILQTEKDSYFLQKDASLTEKDATLTEERASSTERLASSVEASSVKVASPPQMGTLPSEKQVSQTEEPASSEPPPVEPLSPSQSETPVSAKEASAAENQTSPPEKQFLASEKAASEKRASLAKRAVLPEASTEVRLSSSGGVNSSAPMDTAAPVESPVPEKVVSPAAVSTLPSKDLNREQQSNEESANKTDSSKQVTDSRSEEPNDQTSKGLSDVNAAEVSVHNTGLTAAPDKDMQITDTAEPRSFEQLASVLVENQDNPAELELQEAEPSLAFRASASAPPVPSPSKPQPSDQTSSKPASASSLSPKSTAHSEDVPHRETSGDTRPKQSGSELLTTNKNTDVDKSVHYSVPTKASIKALVEAAPVFKSTGVAPQTTKKTDSKESDLPQKPGMKLQVAYALAKFRNTGAAIRSQATSERSDGAAHSAGKTSTDSLTETVPAGKTPTAAAAPTTKPAQPSPAKFTQPSPANPTQPSSAKPDQPSSAGPAEPPLAKTSKRWTAETTQQSSANTSKRSSTKPSKPSSAESAQTSSTKPVQPSSAKASQPSSAKPSQPSSAKPSQSSSAKPSQPSSAKPSQPSSAKPSQPSSAKPSQPSSAKSVQSSSVKPTQTSPAKPTQPSPVKHSQPSSNTQAQPPSGKSSQQSSAKATASSSAKPSQSTSAKLSQPPPAETTQRSSAQVSQSSAKQTHQSPNTMPQSSPAKQSQSSSTKTTQQGSAKTAQSSSKIAQPSTAKTTQSSPAKTIQPSPAKTTQPSPAKTTQPSAKTVQSSKTTQPSSKTSQSSTPKTTHSSFTKSNQSLSSPSSSTKTIPSSSNGTTHSSAKMAQSSNRTSQSSTTSTTQSSSVKVTHHDSSSAKHRKSVQATSPSHSKSKRSSSRESESPRAPQKRPSPSDGSESDTPSSAKRRKEDGEKSTRSAKSGSSRNRSRDSTSSTASTPSSRTSSGAAAGEAGADPGRSAATTDDPLGIGRPAEQLYQPPARGRNSPNVSYCMLCWKAEGELLNCDVCDFAYHRDCYIGSTEQSDGLMWQCVMCRELPVPLGPLERRISGHMNEVDRLLARRLLTELYVAYYPSLYFRSLENFSLSRSSGQQSYSKSWLKRVVMQAKQKLADGYSRCGAFYFGLYIICAKLPKQRLSNFSDIPKPVTLDQAKKRLLDDDFVSLMAFVRHLKLLMEQQNQLKRKTPPHKYLQELDGKFNEFLMRHLKAFLQHIDNPAAQ